MNRIEKLDVIRAITIILVVFGHSIIIYNSSWGIYNSDNSVPFLVYCKQVIDYLQMPLFFSLSGYLFYITKDNLSLKKFLVSKIRRLLVPYFIFSFFYLLPIRLFIKYPHYLNRSLFSILLNDLVLGKDNGHLWFLQTLFCIFVVFFIVNKIIIKFVKKEIIQLSLLFLLNIAIVFIPGKIDFFHLRFNSFWFYIGFVLNRLQFIKKSVSQKILCEVIFCLTVGVSFYLPASRLIGMCISFILVFCIYFVIPDKSNKLLTIISENSFGIYLFHSPLVYITYTFVPNIHPVLLVLINFVFFGSLAFYLSKICGSSKFKIIVGK